MKKATTKTRLYNIKKSDQSFNFVFAWDGWELCFHAKQIQNIYYMNKSEFIGSNFANISL